jgi:ASC-1-like (ASCH) protein
MHYHFNLHDLPFHAIKNKTKKVEGRAMKDENDRYKNIKQGDTIVFENEENHEKIMTVVQFVHHYPTIREMLESEGIENVLSKGLTIEEGIESYYAINTYKERVKSFGIYAIGIKVIE